MLVVGVDSDAKIRRRKGEDRPMVPEAERLEMLAYQRPVDLIYLKDDDEPRWALIKAVAARRAGAHRGPLLQRRGAGGAADDRRAHRGRRAPGVGHDLRAHPPDVHAHGRAARPEAGQGPARA